jgi:hypothetical protein
LYSTFIGGSSTDGGLGIAVDSVGNAYVTGYTQDGTTDYPTTTGAFDTTHNGNEDVFVTKLNAAGSGLLYSTFIGGSSNDYGLGIAIDSSGNAFVAGYTFGGTPPYPTTTGAFDTTHNGSLDVFVTKLNAAGSGLLYSTFIGGSSNDYGLGIAIDGSGNAFVTGYTDSTGYPTTPEVFQANNNGVFDVFVSKFGDYSISGRTLDTTGAPLPNAAMAMSGDNDDFMLSNSQGYFYFGDTISFGEYLVSATLVTHNFNPHTQQVTLNRNKRLIFVGRPTSSGPTIAYADLGGDVSSTAGNVGLPNTNLTLIDTFGNVRTTVTDNQGNYRFEDVRTGAFYIVFAERDGYIFNPPSAQLNFFDENLDVDFTATPTNLRPINDFDGDGKTDLAVFRSAEGRWYIHESQTGRTRVTQFGVAGDIPVAGDYDGDRRTDIAVYRPSEGNWYRLNSSNGQFVAVRFGVAEDRPVAADFDGDGRADLAVWRPSTGVWHRLNSSNGSYAAVQWGQTGDTPLAADFDSDGRADMTIFRNGVWYRLNSSNGQPVTYQFGIGDDVPMARDFDGDGRPDTAVYRGGVWHWLDSADGEYHATQWGLATDIPVPSDYNGDGRLEQAVYRGGVWYIIRPNGTTTITQYGTGGDMPIPAVR